MHVNLTAPTALLVATQQKSLLVIVATPVLSKTVKFWDIETNF